MTYEQAMQSGLFGGANANLSQDFKFDAPIEPPLIDEDMVVPPPPTGDDTAADRFRGRSGRREVDDNAPTRGGKKGKASVAKPKPSRQSGPGRIAVPAGLAALGARVNKVLNPVEKTTGGGMMRVEISPEERARRQKQSQRTTFIVFAVIALVIVGVVAAIVLSLRGNSVDNPAVNPVGTTRLNLTYKTNPVSNTVTVLLDPNSTPGTNSTTNPTTQGTGAATGGRLAVSQAGVIICPASETETDCSLLWRSKIPFVAIDRLLQKHKVDAVMIDNVLGAKLAMRHLLALGHRQIAIITTRLNVTTGRERLEGYYEALAEAGLSVDPALIKIGDIVLKVVMPR